MSNLLQPVLLLVIVLLEIAAGAFTIEEPPSPYHLTIFIGDNDPRKGAEHGTIKIVSEPYSNSNELKLVDVLVDFNSSKCEEDDHDCADSSKHLILKTSSGVPVDVFDVAAGHPNMTYFIYQVTVDEGVPRRELLELILKTFPGRWRRSYDSLEIGQTSWPSIRNAALEALIEQRIQIHSCTIDYGEETPSVDLVMKFVDAVKPIDFKMSVGNRLLNITGPKFVMPDSFFQSEAVRNLSTLELDEIDAEISDESLGLLKATTIRMRDVPNLSYNGFRSWLEPVLNESMIMRFLFVLPQQEKDPVHGQMDLTYILERDFNNSKGFEHRDNEWKIPGFKNKTGTFGTEVTIEEVEVLSGSYVVLSARQIQLERNSVQRFTLIATWIVMLFCV